MRKVVLQMQVSLDMYVADVDHGLDFIMPGFEASVAWMTAELNRTDTMILGRTAFIEQQGYWPTEQAQGNPLEPMINAWEKVVFSSTLTEVTWPNSRIESGDLAEAIGRLKAQDGGTILVSGGATFAQALSARGLIDEYRLVVHPVALGNGLKLFDSQADLRLVSSHALDSGVMALVYERALLSKDVRA